MPYKNKIIAWTICRCGCGGSVWIREYHISPARFSKQGLPLYIRGHVKGSDSCHWKGDAVSDNAGRQRAQSKFKIGPCEKCGDPGVDRHHKDGNTRNNSKKNVSILCRRCHMELDGRLEKLKKIPRPKSPPKMCLNCRRLSKPLRKGRCPACSEFHRRNGYERPRAIDWRERELRLKRKRPCADCGRKAGRNKGVVVHGLCQSCYVKHWRISRR